MLRYHSFIHSSVITACRRLTFHPIICQLSLTDVTNCYELIINELIKVKISDNYLSYPSVSLKTQRLTRQWGSAMKVGNLHVSYYRVIDENMIVVNKLITINLCDSRAHAV